MSRSPAAREYWWFAFGAWAGMTGGQSVDLLMGHPLKLRNIVDDGSTLPFLVMAYGAMALFVGLPFAAWQSWRRRPFPASFDSSWYWPFVFGLIYFPLFHFGVPYFRLIAGQGQGELIGSIVMLYLFGMPILFAEICLRLSRNLLSSSESRDDATLESRANHRT